ncbi:winged helix-turn-helix domain-containing protein [Catellatospora sp. KI3]|uniref:winged helix-turn-helix domain-containing protein n=1 Tax=Catellatospora sp. KI3 TaxID=3041620 RepID=UPI0024827DD1|nr:winged helix-turn-helix domain-containing protein [Catellatospora sp. KI3]MDI1459891.1 winged helix-turn-helix domain-containing protein [Catellatospora sp. KI3]
MTTTLLTEPTPAVSPASTTITLPVSALGDDATQPLTVTLTLQLTGPDAAHAATRLVHALADVEPLRDLPELPSLSTVSTLSIHDGELVQPAAPVVIDLVSRSILIRGRAIRFTRREFDLLHFLARHPGAAFTRLQLMRAVWGHEFSGERTVDVHVRRVRAKLGEHGGALTTVHGFGYRLETPNAIAVHR